MPYLDTTTFEHFQKHRDVSQWPGTSQFTQMVKEFSSEVNRFHDVTTDICSVSDATQESYLHAKYISDLIEEKMVYLEQSQNVAVQNRVNTQAPSLFDANHTGMRAALIREKREEKPKCYNYNMMTGRIRRWT